MEIQINAEYQTLLPPMLGEEYETLKWSIMTEGQHYPIIINQDGFILDGHQRYRACQELGRECEYVVKEFDNPLLEKKFVVETNLQRRQLTLFQKFELAKVLDAINRQLGRERQAHGQTAPGKRLSSADVKREDVGTSAEQTAKIIGTSPRTVERMRKIDEKGTEEEKEAVRKGEKGIRPVYNKIQKREAKKRLAENPPEETDDLTLFKHLGYAPKPWDVWIYTRDDAYGLEYPGSIPAGIVFNLLYFYTEPGDLVVDPMAGGGVVGDVCKATDRHCLMFDINSVRDDVEEHDLGDGFPDIPELQIDLVFLDPPYFKKLEKEYGKDSISALNKAEYLAFFNKLAEDIYSSGATRVALLMSDYTDDETPRGHIFIWDYILRFVVNGWIPVRHIMCPLPTTAMHPDFVVKFRESKKLGRLGRSLVVFEREDSHESI